MRFYLAGAFVACLILGTVDYMFADDPTPCETDIECYQQCMDKGGKAEDCEFGLMNP